MLRDCQIVEPGDWRYHLFVGGRGTGKTKVGAVEIRKRVYAGQKDMMVVACTQTELLKVMIPAIQKEFPADQQPVYKGGDQKILVCHNGIVIDCRTSQQGSIRGPNATFVWLDELVKCWDEIPEKVDEMFSVLDASVRKGGAQFLITTTGNNWKIFRKWYDLVMQKSPLVVWKSGSMKDNEYLSPQAVAALELIYGNSRYARRELDGVIDWETEGALWTPLLINNTRRDSIELIANPPNPNNIRRHANPLHFFRRFVIGVDPATTSHATSDAWGIVVAGLGQDNHIYIIEDCSKILDPPTAVSTIARLHNKYFQAPVIAESNQGGEMVKMIIRTQIPQLEPKLVHAHQNKMTRAQPVVILWDQGRAHIVGKMPTLEEEMTNYNGDEKQKSPNSLDAMVYAVQYLMLEPTFPRPAGWQPNFS